MMKNEILDELWRAKESVAGSYGNDIDKLYAGLKKKQESEAVRIVDFSRRVRTKSS